MPEEMAVRVAEAAEVIVNGYALMKHDLGVRIVNLDTGNVAVFSESDEMLETRCTRHGRNVRRTVFSSARRFDASLHTKKLARGVGHECR